MKLVNHTGSGESCSSLSPDHRVKLLNQPIEYSQMLSFYRHLQGVYPDLPKDYSIYFNAKELKRGYGHIYYQRRLIMIHRRCVEAYIHEMAHMIAYHVFKEDGHGYHFGRCLDSTIKLWEEVKDNGNVVTV